MLSDLEVGQFWAYGYVILRDCLSADEVAHLQAAHDRLLADAPRYDYFDELGTRVLDRCEEKDDSFAALVEHPRVLEAMRDVWGTECLFLGGGNAWANRGDTPWHTDYMPGGEVPGIRIAIYLDEQDADQGALNVIPGSQHPEFNVAIFRAGGYWEKGARPRLRFDRDKVPGAVTLVTRPGDVVLWDGRLWHSAWRRQDGQPRRTMFIGYAPDPGDNLLALGALREAVRSRRKDKYPFIYSQQLLGKGGPALEKMAARLEALGVEGVREP